MLPKLEWVISSWIFVYIVVVQIPYLAGCLRDGDLSPYPQDWMLAACSPMLWAPPLPQKAKPSFSLLNSSVADDMHEMMYVHMQCTRCAYIIAYTCPTQKTKT